MCARKAVIIGGSGFIGSVICQQLVADGWHVRIPTRRRDHARHLWLLPTVEVVEANIFDPAALRDLLADQDVLINLVGVLHSPSGHPYGPAFAKAHVELPKRLAAACAASGVRRVIHISALHAHANGPSEYLRSKAAGEAVWQDAAQQHGLAVTLFRPSVVFGPQDNFLNMFAQLTRLFPLIPLAGASARFQPVYVGDIARAIRHALATPDSHGQCYELAGPDVFTLGELVQRVGYWTRHPVGILPLPYWAGWLQAAAMECLPVPLMSRDNLRSMQVDSVASGVAQPFGLTPTSLSSIAPYYLRHA